MPNVPENVWEFGSAFSGLRIEPLKSPLSNGCMARLFVKGRNVGFITYETATEEYTVTPVYDIDDQTPTEGYAHGNKPCKTIAEAVLSSLQTTIAKLKFDSGVLMGKSFYFEGILEHITGKKPMEK